MYFKVAYYSNIIEVSDDCNCLYNIDEEMIQDLATVDGSNCSACILQLANEGRLPTGVLYKIAYYIQKEYPYLHIDWFTTFYYVEKQSYLTDAFVLKELLEGNSTEAAGERFASFELDEQVEDIDTVILKIVMMNIISFNVIIK